MLKNLNQDKSQPKEFTFREVRHLAVTIEFTDISISLSIDRRGLLLMF